MKLSAFLRDKCLLLLLHLVCMGALFGFLHITGYPDANIALICIFWLLILLLWLLCTFLQRRRFFREAFQILENTEERFLLSEMLPDSCSLEDALYREMLRLSNKSAIENIRLLEDAQKEYRDYLESWVHEIKTPVSVIDLLCENAKYLSKNTGGQEQSLGTNAGSSRGETLHLPPADGSSEDETLHLSTAALPATKETLRNIRLENRKIENCVDLVLYHARSEAVYKDYLIRETDLREVIYEALEKERLLLIQHHIQADVSCHEKVYTDKKWIIFILNQMILNSVKYRSSTPFLRFYTQKGKDSVVLTAEDNGTGILPEDLPRIFEKGFTGSNGRDHEKATGMGLYLCKKLCDQLGIALNAQLEYGKGTKMLLRFPVSSYIVRG